MSKLRMGNVSIGSTWIKVLAIAVATASLPGCISTPSNKVLVTPFGVAGIHSFRPQQTPDTTYAQAKTMDRMTVQNAGENGTDKQNSQ
jgi:hypothetical protein